MSEEAPAPAVKCANCGEPGIVDVCEYEAEVNRSAELCPYNCCETCRQACADEI